MAAYARVFCRAVLVLMVLAVPLIGSANAQTTGTSITLPDGTVCNPAGATPAPMAFQGLSATYICSNPSVVLLGPPAQSNGQLTVTRGAVSGGNITSATQITVTMTRVQLADGSTCVLQTGATVTINGQRLNYTCGDPSIGILGDFNSSQPMWTANKVVTTAGANGPVVQSQQTVGVTSTLTSNQAPTGPTPTPQATATPTAATTIQLPDGTTCNFAGTGATAVFNGQRVNYTCGTRSDGGLTVILGNPTLQNGVWTITVGIVDTVNNQQTLRSSDTLNVQFVEADLADGTACTLVSGGNRITVEGQPMNYTCGRSEEGLLGDFNTSQPLWTTVKVVVQQNAQGAFTVQQRDTLGITKVVAGNAAAANATSITLPDGTTCNFSGTGATITFNGQRANYTCSNPALVILGTPTLQNGIWNVTVGNVSGATITSSSTVQMSIAQVALLDGSTCASTGTGSTIAINGQRLNYTCGDQNTGLFGDFNTSQPLWTAQKIVFQTGPQGATAQSTATVGIASVKGVPPQTPPGPAPTPTPAPGPAQPAPPQERDERYFPETMFRIANDAFWNFFNSRGGIDTFGFPVSRQFGFLGCPVQIFQRLIMQQCGSSAPVTLINMLDPEIFPYTVVNTSVFPGPDDAIKNATPSVNSPNYDTAIIAFVQQVVPDQWNGAPVNFQSTFFATGGLEIWGAPISNPAYDPGNRDFIYQRFQRGIMHYTTGQGTRGVLLADYFKAIMLGPEKAAQKGASLPPDLNDEAKSSKFYTQYCPGNNLWLCRPQDMPGSDLTFAFEAG